MPESKAQSAAVPKNTTRNRGLLIAAVMACMAVMPRSADKRASAVIRKAEKAKKFPANSAVPSAAKIVTTNMSCSIRRASPSP
jgi:hypothetical protein